VIAAGIIALVALAATVASLVWLQLQPTKLSPIRDPVSQYGITGYRDGYRAATIAFGAAGLALAVGISQALGTRGLAAAILLVVFAITRAVISWFPMDAPGHEVDTHRVGALCAGLRRLRIRAGGCRCSRGGPLPPWHVARAGSRLRSSGLCHDRLPGPYWPGPDGASAPSALGGDRARLLPVRDHLVRCVRCHLRCGHPLDARQRSRRLGFETSQ